MANTEKKKNGDLLTRMSSVVIHEIRNPLTVIQMLYHSLRLEFPPEDPRAGAPQWKSLDRLPTAGAKASGARPSTRTLTHNTPPARVSYGADTHPLPRPPVDFPPRAGKLLSSSLNPTGHSLGMDAAAGKTTVTTAQKRRGLPFALGAQALNAFFAQITFGSSVFILYLNELGFDKSRIGFLLSLFPFAGIVAVLLGPPVAQPHAQRRAVHRGFHVVHA